MEEKKPWEIAAEEQSGLTDKKPWELAAEETELVKKKESTNLGFGSGSSQSGTPLMMKSAAGQPDLPKIKDIAVTEQQETLPDKKEKVNPNADLYRKYESSQSQYKKANEELNIFNSTFPESGVKSKNLPSEFLLEYESGKKKMADNFNQKKAIADYTRKEILEKINTDVDRIYSTYGAELMKKSAIGKSVANKEKIQEISKNEARKAGLPEDGYFYTLLKTQLSAKAEWEEIKPDVESKFNEIYKKKYGVSPSEEQEKDFAARLGQVEAIKAKTKSAIERLASEISATSELSVKELGEKYKSSIEELNKAIDTDPEISQYQNDVVAAIYQNYQDLVNSGKMSIEEANEYFKSDDFAKEVLGKTNQMVSDKYGAQLNESYSNYLKELNQTKTKYNSQFVRQQEEILSFANKEIEKEYKKAQKDYKMSPALEKKYKDAYGEAYKQVVEKKLKGEESIVYAQNAMVPFYTSTLSGLGSAFKGMGTTFGLSGMSDFGERLEANYATPDVGIKKVSDIFDGTSFAVSSGQLLGRMAPGIGVGVGTAILTRNINLAAQLAATGFAGWATETSDMVGTMYNEVLEDTGDAAKANNAANKMLEAQTYMMPTYALEGLPFFGKALKVVPTVLGRAATGVAIEFGTEMIQEIPQGAFEEAIKAEDDLGDFSKYITWEKSKQTMLQMAPIAVLGGGPVLYRGAKDYGVKKYAEAQAKSYILKNDISGFLETSPEQFLFNVHAAKGTAFSKAFVSLMYSNGNISADEMTKLTAKVEMFDQYKELLKKSKIKIPAEQVGFRVFSEYQEAKNDFESENNPDAKNILSEKLKTKEQDFKDFFGGKGVNLVRLKMQNGEEYVFSPEEMNEALKYENIRNAINNKEIEVSVYVKKGQEGIMQSTINSMEVLFQEKKPTFTKFTSPTDDKYGTVNRNDGKGEVTLTKEEYLKESGTGSISEPVVAGAVIEQPSVDVSGVGAVTAEGVEVGGQKVGQAAGQEVEKKEVIRNQAKEEIAKVLDDNTLTEQQKEEKVSQIVKAAKVQMNIKENDLRQPSIKFEPPTFTVEVSKPFVETLNKLGYSDADISNMTIDQQWDIVNNKTQAPEVVSAAKVDSVKENKRQERIAEMQKELDELAVLESTPASSEAQKAAPAEKVEKVQDSSEAKNPALSSVEETAKGLEDYIASLPSAIQLDRFPISKTATIDVVGNEREVAEAYHKAKSDGSNPELVKAVEKLFNDSTSPNQVNQPVQQDAATSEQQGTKEAEVKKESAQAILPETKAQKAANPNISSLPKKKAVPTEKVEEKIDDITIPTKDKAFSKEEFVRDIDKLEKEKANGSKNIGLYSFKDKFVKLVKSKRKLSKENLNTLRDRVSDMDNVYPALEIIDLPNGSQAIVMDKATGKIGNELSESEINEIPQAHWDKFEKTIRELSKRGIQTDLTKRSNVLYDKNKGFQFIDLEGASIEGDATNKFFEKDGKEFYYDFEKYPFFPRLYKSAKEIFTNIGVQGETNAKGELKEQPKAETQKKVEVTAKALEGVDKKELEKLSNSIGETLSKKKTKIDTENNSAITSFGKQIKFRISKSSDPEIEQDFLTITVIDNNGNKVGYATFLDNGEGNLEGSEVEVSAKNQKQGIASAIYSFADAKGYNVKESVLQTPEGRALWKSLKTKQGSVKSISEAYHKAKANGSNPELVKAVEKLFNDSTSPNQVNQPVQQDAATEVQKQITEVEKIISELENNPNSPFHKLVNLEDKRKELVELENKQAELKALEQPIQSEIEVQKADIERRSGLNGVEEIIFSNPNFRLEGFEIDGNYWNVVTSTDRAKVLVNINGVIVPFYLTTGQAGKGLVPGWYPFFGIGKDGWLNKTDKSDMETYYERYWGKETADIVKSISEELNSFYGTNPSTFKNDGDPNATSRPLTTLADKVEDYINSKLNYTPAINNADARKTLRSNVEQLGREINAKYDAEVKALEQQDNTQTIPIQPEIDNTQVQKWKDKFEELKSNNDTKGIQEHYDKLNVALNGLVKGDGNIAEMQKLKKDIEDYARTQKNINLDNQNINNENRQQQTGEQLDIFGETKGKPTWQQEQDVIDSDASLTTEQKQQKKVEVTAKALDVADKKDIEFIARKENNRRKGSFYEKAKNILFKGFGGDASVISDKFGSKYKYFTDNSDYAKAFSLEKEYLTQIGKVEKYETNYNKEYNTSEKNYEDDVLKYSGKKNIVDLTSKDFDNYNDKLKLDGYDVVIIKRIEPLILSESYRGHSADIRNVEVQEHLILNDKAVNKIADQPSLLKNSAQSISEAYHKAKADGSNPELVKAVEELLTPKENAKEQKQAASPESDANYKLSQEVTENVSKENPGASILIQPKGEDLSLAAVYVGKENRGKGIGSKVLESVKKEADRVGKKVVLDATNELDEETDLERLGKFYERNGFKKVGENKYEYNPTDEKGNQKAEGREEGLLSPKGLLSPESENKPSEKEVGDGGPVSPAPLQEPKFVTALERANWLRENRPEEAPNEREWINFVIDYSNDEAEFIETYLAEGRRHLENTEDSGYNEFAEAMLSIKVSTADWNRYVDRKQMSGSIAFNHIKKGGKYAANTLDIDLLNQDSGLLVDISPDEWGEWILDYYRPQNKGVRVMKKTPMQKKLRDAFYEKFGKDLTSKYIEDYLDQYLSEKVGPRTKKLLLNLEAKTYEEAEQWLYEQIKSGAITLDADAPTGVAERIKKDREREKQRAEAKRQAEETRQLTEPKNAVDVAKIFNRVFGFTPWESGVAARMFDAKATRFARALGITKEEYYKRYWLGKDVEGGLKQIVGENAQLAQDIRDNLQVARDMEVAGKDAKTIRIATGWERGRDKKWKYEIEDIKTPNKQVFNKAKEGVNITLYDLIGDNQIFNLYPQFKNLKIKFNKESYYSGLDKTIYLSKDFTNLSAKSTIIHELQHAIQDVEGFAFGTTGSREMASIKSKYNDSLVKILLKENKEYSELYEKASNMTAYEIVEGKYIPNKERQKIDERLEEIFKEFADKNPIDEKELLEKAKRNYLANKGEVEARNVQKRMGMTPEKRRATTLQETDDVATYEQIVLFQDGEKGSWSKEAAYAKRIISMYSKADSTTAAHEILGHDYLDNIIQAAALGDKESIDDLDTIVNEFLKSEKARGVTRSAAMKAIKEFDVEKNNTDLGRKIHEWFSTQAEQYFANGDNLKPEVANTKLGRLFEKFRQHVADLYQKMNKALIPPSPAMKKVFRKLFGEENFGALEHNDKIVEQAKEDINNIKPVGEIDDVFGGVKEKKGKLFSEEMTNEERILKGGRMMLDRNMTDKYNIVKDIKARLFKIHGNKDAWPLVDELEEQLVSMDKPGEGKLYNATIERLLQDPNLSNDVKEKLRAKEIRERDHYSLLEKIENDVDFVNLVGPEAVADMLIEEGPKTNSQMSDDSFVRMAEIVVKRMNAMRRGMSFEDRARLTEKSVQIADMMAQKGSEASKTLNSFRAWNMLDKDGLMLRIKRRFDEDNKDKKKKAKSKAKQFQEEYEKMKAEYDAMFDSLLETEEVVGTLREELAELDKKIEELEKAKARRTTRESKGKLGVKEGQKVTTKVKAEDVKRFLATKFGKKLAQDDVTDAEVYEFGASLMDKRRDFTHFVKEFNKATGESYSPKELRDIYLGAVDVMTGNGYEGGFSDIAEIAEVVTDFEIEKDAAETIARRDLLKKQEVILKELAEGQRKALIEDVGKQINSRGLWGKYIDSVTGELVSKVSSLLSSGGTTDRALLDEFTSMVTNAIKEKLEEVLPNNKVQKAPKTEKELSEMIGDLAKNEEKFAEVFDAMVEKLQEKYKNDVNKINALQALANIQNPFSEKLLSKTMDVALKNTGWDKGTIAFGRGSSMLGANLAYGIMNQAGLIGTPYESVVGPLLETAFAKSIKQYEDSKVESLANFMINDAKKAIGAVSPKNVTFVDELLNALKKVAREEYKAKNKPVPTDPMELLRFALKNIGEAERIGESVMDRAKAMVNAKIMADKSMTQNQKRDAIRFLDGLVNSVFDTIVPESTMEKLITKAIKASGVFLDQNGNIAWEKIVTDINGGVELVRKTIEEYLRNELGNSYSPALVDAALQRISDKYESMLDEKRQELFEKQLGSFSSKLFKSIVKDRRIGGMVGKLIAMSKSGMLNYTQYYDLISEYLGLNEMTAQEWSELEYLLERVEDAPEGFERITALEDATLYLESKMPGYGFKVYWAIKYANMLGGISTFVKNATGTADLIFTALGRTITSLGDTNYIKLALKGLKQGDFLDIIKRGSANQGDRVEMPQDSMGLVSVNTLERWRKTPGYRPVKNLFGSLVAVPRILGGTDAAVQRGVSEITDYYLTKKLLKFRNPGMSRQALRAAALDSMFDGNTTFDAAISQAVIEMNQRGIRANLQDIMDDLKRPVVLQDKQTIRARRRAYEIIRKNRNKVVTELSGRDALKVAFKTEYRDNRGVATFAGKFIQGAFNSLEEALLGNDPSAKRKLAVKVPQKMIMPIIRGIANFTEVTFEKFLPYGIAKGALKYGKYANKKATTEEEKLLFEFKKMQAKDMMFSAMVANAVTFLAIEMLMAGVDDDDEVPNGYYGAGTYKLKNGKAVVIPQNSIVLGGRIIPMAYFGTMAFSLSAVGSYNAQKEKDSFNAVDFTTDIFTGVLSASMFESFTRIFDIFKPTYNQQDEGFINRLGEYALNLLTSEVSNTVMPWSSMQRQLNQARKMAFSDHDLDLAIGFQEKVVKSMPLLNMIPGLSYSRPDIDYVGDPIPGNIKYPEGAAGFFGMLRRVDIPEYKSYDNKIGLNVPYEGKTLDNKVSREVMTDEMYYDYKRDVANAFKPYQEYHFKNKYDVSREEPTTDEGSVTFQTKEKQKEISIAMFGKPYGTLDARERGKVNQGLNYRNQSEAVHSALEGYYRSVYMNGMKMRNNTEKRYDRLVEAVYATLPEGSTYNDAKDMTDKMLRTSRRKKE